MKEICILHNMNNRYAITFSMIFIVTRLCNYVLVLSFNVSSFNDKFKFISMKMKTYSYLKTISSIASNLNKMKRIDLRTTQSCVVEGILSSNSTIQIVYSPNTFQSDLKGTFFYPSVNQYFRGCAIHVNLSHETLQ